jgi:hypothetical protein
MKFVLSVVEGRKQDHSMTILQTFEHKGRVLKLASYDAPVRPARKPSTHRVPGAGKFEIMQFDISQADNNLTLTAQVGGKNIAYLFIEILMKDRDKYYGPVLREYIPAAREKETGGVKHPDWDETIDLSFPLRPRLTLLTDGVDSAFAFALPEGYGVSGCRLDGQYTNAEKQSRARITFDGDGRIKEILAFKEQRMKSTPHALTPKPGGTFAPFVQVLTPPHDENGKWEAEIVLSTALTFGERPFRLEKESLIPGEYLAGILIQDLDGGFTRKYVPFTVGS